MKLQKENIFGVYSIRKGNKKILLTENLIPGKRHFDEQIIKSQGKEFRIWEPSRSKLAAVILKGCSNIEIKKSDIVLYLGSSHGYTCTFVSDIIGKDGFIFALDFAPRVVRDLVFVCEDRKNIAPILADANKPKSYLDRVSLVDVIYMDLAQKNQAEIFLKNCDLFLKKKGYALLAVKARSVDVTKKPKQVFNLVKNKIEEKLKIIDYKEIGPFQKDHCFFVCRKE